MGIDVDSYLARRYHLKRYNCWHMACDAWRDLTGQDLGDRTPEIITRAALIGRFDSDVPNFERIADPESPCLVLMRNPGTVPHVGVFMANKILQMTHNGASFTRPEIATLGFRDVGYYRCRKD